MLRIPIVPNGHILSCNLQSPKILNTSCAMAITRFADHTSFRFWIQELIGAMMLHSPFLTTKDIARYCNVTVQTVIDWIIRRLLKAYQLTRFHDFGIDPADFMDFLRQHHNSLPQKNCIGKNRALVIDDEIFMANAIQRVFRNQGFKTLIASDGFQAGALLNCFHPTIVTLDIKMSRLSGIEVIKFIRSTEHLKRINIIIISAMPHQELDVALKAGANDILSKPFKNAELVKKVKNLAGGLEPETAKAGKNS